MKTLSSSLKVSFLLVLLAFPQMAYAADISIRSKYIRLDVNEGFASGKLQVWVRNLTETHLKNVNLRLSFPLDAKLDKGVLQLRTVPKGHGRVAKAEVFFVGGNFDPKESLVWDVEYDLGKGGEHKQTIVNDRN
ncbi:MAG: hypothetical protein HOI59_03355 [Nitrospina sp.]|nr:hypothetical protein [Nitrospina sp.]MBT3415508.1 hypothetical protein [Nitrospina sp.]MBT3855843.1 hypothetical protein [Nitrospina sp.]MBT4104630.1 hypothetical protein [Nitrospina sp.]MBT4390854.1 hypothetical protein [Nitrospina sp.]